MRGKLYRHLRQGHKRYRRGKKEKVPAKSADDVTKTTIELLMPYKEHVHTITVDNGSEEPMRMLTQYVKKGTDLTTVTDSDIEFAVSRINYRPKKCLDFKQPAIVFKEMALVA